MIGAVGIGGEVAVAVRVAQGLYMWTEEGATITPARGASARCAKDLVF